MERRATSQPPALLLAAIGFIACSAVVTALGQVLDRITEVFAMRKFPRPAHGKYLRIRFLGDQAQGLIGGKTCFSHDHDTAHPRWGEKASAPAAIGYSDAHDTVNQ
jgi:hypothetical protein